MLDGEAGADADADRRRRLHGKSKSKSKSSSSSKGGGSSSSKTAEPTPSPVLCSAHDLIVDPFECADLACGQLSCDECGDQKTCTALCKAWLDERGLKHCKSFKGRWCAKQCDAVDAKLKCFFPCAEAPVCPDSAKPGSASASSSKH